MGKGRSIRITKIKIAVPQIKIIIATEAAQIIQGDDGQVQIISKEEEVSRETRKLKRKLIRFKIVGARKLPHSRTITA